MIVVDTNIIAYLHIQGEFTERCEKLYSQDSHWVAPLLWRSEFRNILAGYLRKNILSLSDATEMILSSQSMLQTREYEVSSVLVMQLVQQSNCSAYDCEFVALAQELKLPLVTADKKILTTFPNITKSLNSFDVENFV
jgi:predicted nucleic acid-binding protein